MSHPRDDRTAAPGAGAAAIVPPEVGDVRASSIFKSLKWTSFTHSCIYAALLVCAFAAGKPEPTTFVLGLTHGILWILMSLVCIACVRLRIVPLRLAAAVAVLGGIGPFFGSFEFVREQRRRERTGDRPDPTVGMTIKPCEGQVKPPPAIRSAHPPR